MKKILVIGSLNTDMVIKTNRLPLPGETVIGENFLMNPGGKGANQAVAASRLGGDIYFVTKTGNDLFGKRAIEQYRAEGINTDYILGDKKLPSGVALILVDANGENSIAVAPGSNMALTPEDIDGIEPLIKKCDFLLMQLEIPMETVEYAAKLAHREGKKVILNPAPARNLSNELLSHLYMLVPNETEAEILSGVKVTDEEKARKASEIIAAKGVEKVVVTMGAKGAFIREAEGCTLVPTVKVKAVDTTAAGDTFCGALCVGLSEDMPTAEAVAFACRCSAITVTRMGAQMSIPCRREVAAM